MWWWWWMWRWWMWWWWMRWLKTRVLDNDWFGTGSFDYLLFTAVMQSVDLSAAFSIPAKENALHFCL
jgi:hypothetical protein